MQPANFDSAHASDTERRAIRFLPLPPCHHHTYPTSIVLYRLTPPQVMFGDHVMLQSLGDQFVAQVCGSEIEMNMRDESNAS